MHGDTLMKGILEKRITREAANRKISL